MCARINGRRAFVLLAVLIALAMALLAAAGAISIARGAVADTRGGERSAIARAAALDGVAFVSASLASARQELLQGNAPPSIAQRDGELLERTVGSERLVTRLVPFEDGTFFQAEAGKLGMEDITDDMLKRILASAAVELSPTQFRARAGLHALEAVDATSAALLPFLTRYASEPMIDGEGDPRVLLAESLDDVSTRRLREVGGDALLRVAARAFADSEGDSKSFESRVVRALRAEAVEVEEWDAALHALSGVDGDRVNGRVSVQFAPSEVLGAIEGIGVERGARIVEERALLSLDERRGCAWLVSHGILTPEEFVAVVSRCTARCLQWRFSIEAGYEPLDVAPKDERFTARNTARFDCVIDFADATPRLALLRDTSMRGAFAAIATQRSATTAETAPIEEKLDSTDMTASKILDPEIADNEKIKFTEVTFTIPKFSSANEGESDKMAVPTTPSRPLGSHAVGRWVSSGTPRSTPPRVER